VRQAAIETFLTTSGKNVLPAAPSPDPRATLSPLVRHCGTPAGELEADDADDGEAEDDEGLPDAELAADEVLAPPLDADWDLLPQPPRSNTAAKTSATAGEGFFTAQVSGRTDAKMRGKARVG
jgi:hypothetical protein